MDEMEREIEECAELMERKGELELKIRKYPLEVRAQARYGKRLSPCPICGMMPEMIDSLMFIQVMCWPCKKCFKVGISFASPEEVAIDGWNSYVAQIKKENSIS